LRLPVQAKSVDQNGTRCSAVAEDLAALTEAILSEEATAAAEADAMLAEWSVGSPTMLGSAASPNSFCIADGPGDDGVERFSIAEEVPQFLHEAHLLDGGNYPSDLGDLSPERFGGAGSPSARRVGAGLRQTSWMTPRSQVSPSSTAELPVKLTPQSPRHASAHTSVRQQPQQQHLCGGSPRAGRRGSPMAGSCSGCAEVVNEELVRYNEALKRALGVAVRKLAQLEGENERFLAEDVFDLVNSLCGSGSGASNIEVAWQQPRQRWPMDLEINVEEWDAASSAVEQHQQHQAGSCSRPSTPVVVAAAGCA